MPKNTIHYFTHKKRGRVNTAHKLVPSGSVPPQLWYANRVVQSQSDQK